MDSIVHIIISVNTSDDLFSLFVDYLFFYAFLLSEYSLDSLRIFSSDLGKFLA